MLVCVSCSILHARPRVQRAPGLPLRPLILRARRFLAQLGRNAPRGGGGVSEAKPFAIESVYARTRVTSPCGRGRREAPGEGLRSIEGPEPLTPPSPTRGEGARERSGQRDEARKSGASLTPRRAGAARPAPCASPNGHSARLRSRHSTRSAFSQNARPACRHRPSA
jgi:hypothetical protein